MAKRIMYIFILIVTIVLIVIGARILLGKSRTKVIENYDAEIICIMTENIPEKII